MKQGLKFFLNRICQVIAFPVAMICWFEKRVSKGSEQFFQFGSQIFALVPGLPGVFLRRAFYSLTLSRCSLNCHIGFGSVFSHRNVVVEDQVYIGLFNIIGSAHLKEKTFIASRVSVLSGKFLHVRDANGDWTPFDPDRMIQIKIGPNAWVGEGALIMADVGEGSLVGAGAVVNQSIVSNMVVAGNPARNIKELNTDK